ncbi:MotA/TolQ/ExbB proton channel family protein [Leptolyngbya sp. FACHB-36]|uniref:MotA/TolQ/ExbB proton channel family protein n=1 Tax=Leptolyngbya sp. FACHB-36 TaxID=2692808 RepID=UPI00168134B8|nr:MotA/TolQ/ExbB proton channel family protein [Leptolyngbya sp. FACHB-36]MBD2018857.1 MotA/TolQ/ExbB proton channel family protein [Leptolyngbya sp. FACHB-36]
MSNLYSLVAKGGPIMIPIVALSIGTLACALERGLFWYQLLSQEKQIVQDVLAAARTDLHAAAKIAEQAQTSSIGRFLLAPLQLISPTPETFRLAMETAGEEELIEMRRGNDLLESTVAVGPLLGLLGTVTGLIVTFSSLTIGNASPSQSVDLSKSAAGIAEALITTAGGMIVAILALCILRVFMRLQRQQMDYFASVGSRLELVYRQFWYEPVFHANRADGSSESVNAKPAPASPAPAGPDTYPAALHS